MSRSKKSASSEPEGLDDMPGDIDSDELDIVEDLPTDEIPEDIEEIEFEGEIEEDEIEEDVEVLAGEGGAKELPEEEEDEESEYEGDEREPTLDEILKERSGLAEEEAGEEEVEEEEDDDEDNDSLTRRVLLRGKGEIGEDEFVCKSCFLVKHRSQLADPRRRLCRDCI